MRCLGTAEDAAGSWRCFRRPFQLLKDMYFPQSAFPTTPHPTQLALSLPSCVPQTKNKQQPSETWRQNNLHSLPLPTPPPLHSLLCQVACLQVSCGWLFVCIVVLINVCVPHLLESPRVVCMCVLIHLFFGHRVDVCVVCVSVCAWGGGQA
jgi:hypothetical protein